jgi:small multidrug resistance family-3 protein
MWHWLREKWAWWAVVLDALVLVGYGVVPTLQPASFGRVYAAYGEVFVVMSMLWGCWVDGQRPNRWDIIGAALCVAGVTVMIYFPREGGSLRH